MIYVVCMWVCMLLFLCLLFRCQFGLVTLVNPFPSLSHPNITEEIHANFQGATIHSHYNETILPAVTGVHEDQQKRGVSERASREKRYCRPIVAGKWPTDLIHTTTRVPATSHAASQSRVSSPLSYCTFPWTRIWESPRPTFSLTFQHWLPLLNYNIKGTVSGGRGSRRLSQWREWGA